MPHKHNLLDCDSFLTVCKGMLCKNLTLNHHISQTDVFCGHGEGAYVDQDGVCPWMGHLLIARPYVNTCGLSTLLKGTSGALAGLLHVCPHWGLF